MLRVAICEDDRRLRRTLVKSLSAFPDLNVVAELGSGEEAVTAVLALAPEVLLLDLELPAMQGVDVIRALCGRVSTEILVLTTFDDQLRVYEAVREGAAGYLVKRVSAAQIAEAIREVAAGGSVIDPLLARRFWCYFESQRGRGAGEAFGLSPAEREVLQLVARGLSNPEVGLATGSSRRSVKAHLESIYRKLGVCTRVAAVTHALRVGLIEL